MPCYNASVLVAFTNPKCSYFLSFIFRSLKKNSLKFTHVIPGCLRFKAKFRRNLTTNGTCRVNIYRRKFECYCQWRNWVRTCRRHTFLLRSLCKRNSGRRTLKTETFQYLVITINIARTNKYWANYVFYQLEKQIMQSLFMTTCDYHLPCWQTFVLQNETASF